MNERERIFELASCLIDDSPADDTEVCFREDEHNLTRFANNTIHQNVSVTDAQVLVRVAFGRKLGVAGSNSLESLADVLDQACEMARVSEDSPLYAGMPKPQEPKEVEAFDDATAGCDAAGRARRVKSVVEEAKRVGAAAAGALTTSAAQSAVVNSNGVRVFHRGTETRLNIVMTRGGGSAAAIRTGWRLADADDPAAAGLVAERAVRCGDPRDVDPGEYVVVLEPQAVGVLTEFLAYLGFNGKAYREKRSFMSGKLGLTVTGRLITILDDGLDVSGIPAPFDWEGVARKRITLIERGVATGMCFDTATAAAEKTVSTGHALPANSDFGPFPLNLFMSAGDSSVEQMIASTAKGLLVSNFHYANVAEPMRAVVTGMTRFGVFMIRDGKVSHPVKNLRFTQSVLEALDSACALTKERRLVEGIGGVMLVPGMKCESFNFTGKTEF
jgi:predicted Zn-dependent protease